MTGILRCAMESPDDYVIELSYRDSKGEVTRRTISPIRFLAPGRFLALCLCREEPRQFHVDRCSRVALKSANDVVMPVAIR